jgi:ketosteroid isomerase-like protein
MSEENVRLVRAVLDAMNRGDWDAAYEDAAPDIEFDSTRDLGEWRGVHTGRDEVMRAWERFAEPWESVQIEVDEVIDAGDHVVSRTTFTLTGRDGIEVRARNSWLWTIRDGKGTRVVTGYETTQEALEAAGLPEQDGLPK